MARPGYQLWYFAVPAVAAYAFVMLVPAARSIGLAFTNWNGVSQTAKFVGLQNFRSILSDDAALTAILHTVLYAIGITVLQNLIGLLLALGLHSKVKSRKVLRVFFFGPVLVMPVVSAFLWQYLLSPDGALDAILDALGLNALQHSWLGDPITAFLSVIIVVTWQFSGFSMVIFLAGLEGVPRELLEAAAVDGADGFKRFWYVTRPLLAPATTVNLTLSMVGGLKIFDQVWALTQGGPGHATESVSTLIYKDGFQFGRFGYSIALALILTVVVAVFGIIQYRDALGRQQ